MIKHNYKFYLLKFWLDIFTVGVCFFTTALIIKGKSGTTLNLFDVGFYFFLSTCWYFTSKANNLYNTYTIRRLSVDVFKTFNIILGQAIFASIFMFAMKYEIYGRLFLLIYISLLTVLMPIEKFFVKHFILFLNKGSFEKKKVLIVGAGKTGMEFSQIIQANPHLGYKVIGFLDDQPKAALNGSYLGKVEKLKEIFDSNVLVDEVVLALPNSAIEQVKHVVKLSSNESVRLKIVPDFLQLVSTKYSVGMFGSLPVISTGQEPLEDEHWRLMKRLFDIGFSLGVLVLIGSWLFPLVALLIKLDSRGPILFKQLRLGRNKVPFYCYKFRSMHINTDADVKKASKGDDRITRIGKILRKTNIDELPQFYNALIGNMSVVGPRPHMLAQNYEYSKIIAKYMVRQLIKPGITGWAQVNGFRGETINPVDMQHRVEHDLWYLENWSFKFDLKIIFLTVWNMIKGEENAY